MKTMTFDVNICNKIKYIAQDQDGVWYGFAKKPVPSDSTADKGGIWLASKSYDSEVHQLARCEPSEDWTTELYKVT